MVFGEEIYIVDIDGLDAAISDVENGNLTGTVISDTMGEAQAVANVATIAINGDPLKTCYKVDNKKITRA